MKMIKSEFAEFYGIMLGDGCCYSKNYQITISGGTIDGTYITEHIPNLIKLNSKNGLNRALFPLMLKSKIKLGCQENCKNHS